MRLLRIYFRQSAMNVSAQMAYKANFFIRLIVLGLTNFLGPLLILFIYQTTPGVPGWTFPEFILLLGSFSIVMGLGHTFVDVMSYDTLEHIHRGTFDSILVKPMNPLITMTTKAFWFQNISEVLAGILLVGWAALQLQIGWTWHWLLYGVLIGIAFLFHYSIHVLICSIAFLVIHSDGLYRIYWRLADFARYPKDIYALGLQLFLTFLFPVTIASFVPAQALLRGMTFMGFLTVVTPVVVFSCLALWLWALGMRKYSSAGG